VARASCPQPSSLRFPRHCRSLISDFLQHLLELLRVFKSKVHRKGAKGAPRRPPGVEFVVEFQVGLAIPTLRLLDTAMPNPVDEKDARAWWQTSPICAPTTTVPSAF
jgi:hypothetical protein